MANEFKSDIERLSSSAVGPSEDCSLELSVDGKWVRLLVGGRLSAAFNIAYVHKVIGENKRRTKKIGRRTDELPADL